MLLVIAYEIGPANWLHNRLGHSYHILADILLFGSVGPALTFVLLHFLDRWLEERETSELQAQRLAQVREEAKNSRTLNDNAMQVLFAASTLIALLKSDQHELPSETAVQLEETAQALDRAVRQLRAHLTG